LRLKASVTIETALVMPMVLLVIFFILSIGFIEHDKAVFTEQSVIIAREISLFGKEQVLNNSINSLCMTAESISVEPVINSTKTSVSIKGAAKVLLFNKIIRLGEKQDYVNCYAPSMIRFLNVGMHIKEYLK